jgi:hypothetical protein
MTDFEVEQKFRQMAQRHLQAAQVDQLLELIRDIDKQPKVDDLIATTKV